MKMLIDYVNVGQWDRAAFYRFGEQLGKPWVRSWPDIAMEMILRYPARVRRLIPDLYILERRGATRQEHCVWAVESVDDNLMQSTDGIADVKVPDEDFLAYLGELSTLWRWVVTRTAADGPTARVLDYMLTELRFKFQDTQDPWRPTLTTPMPAPWSIEQRIMAEYLAPFVANEGELFKRVRTCNDPHCGKLFIYNRPKQTFCNNDCRYHFHNVTKIQSGYLAEHQRSGRKNNPATYLRK